MNLGEGEHTSVHTRENDTLSRGAISAAILKDKVRKGMTLQKQRYKSKSEHDLSMEF